MITAAVVSYVIMNIAQRRKEKAHNNLSASRRDKDSGIEMFGERTGSREYRRADFHLDSSAKVDHCHTQLEQGAVCEKR